MGTHMWLIISVISSVLLGIFSNIVANIIQPHLEKRKKVLISLFLSIFCFTIVASVLANEQSKIRDLPGNSLRGEILLSDNKEWMLLDLSDFSRRQVHLPDWED